MLSLTGCGSGGGGSTETSASATDQTQSPESTVPEDLSLDNIVLDTNENPTSAEASSLLDWWRNHGGGTGSGGSGSGSGGGTPPPDCTPVMDGYGKNGPYTMVNESFVNPMWTGTGSYPVTVFYPEERTDPAPVMFFSHGLGGYKWISYKSIITNLATRGFVVVFSPYPNQLIPVLNNYDIMWNGFVMATQQYASRMDLTKVGFLGHSYGGGTVPAMAQRGLEQGWGTQGAFMYPMAPWYVYDMTSTQLASFPANMKLIVQVYNEDVINDHRMGIDIFNSTTSIPTTEKAYYNGLSGAVEPVGHTVPTNQELNQLDSDLVQKPLNALIDYAFNLGSCVDQAKAYALDGQGVHFQNTVTKNPAPAAAESTYSQRWSSYMNPRRWFDYPAR
jgi:hypothetical protein